MATIYHNEFKVEEGPTTGQQGGAKDN